MSCLIFRWDMEHSSQNQYCPVKIGACEIVNHIWGFNMVATSAMWVNMQYVTTDVAIQFVCYKQLYFQNFPFSYSRSGVYCQSLLHQYGFIFIRLPEPQNFHYSTLLATYPLYYRYLKLPCMENCQCTHPWLTLNDISRFSPPQTSICESYEPISQK